MNRHGKPEEEAEVHERIHRQSAEILIRHRLLHQLSYAKAAKAELSQDWDAAFRLYVKATEGFLHLSRISADDGARKRFKASAGKALERAEKIKAVKKDAVNPVVADAFSERSLVFLLWSTLFVMDRGRV